jgi:hypothetical protein
MTRKLKRTHRKAVIISAVLLLVGLSSILGFWFLGQNLNPDFQQFRDHYQGIMESLDSSEVRLNMTSQLDRKYNFTTLFTWEHSRLTFTPDLDAWLEDPRDILHSGRGICVQFSIVYVSACLALDIQSRLIVAANTTTWKAIHVWAEVNYKSSWVHVDPSDQVWNDASRYQEWNWGEYIGRDVKIYAFEPRKCEDVTQRYGTK